MKLSELQKMQTLQINDYSLWKASSSWIDFKSENMIKNCFRFIEASYIDRLKGSK